MALLRALFKHLIKYFDNIKHLDDFRFGKLLIKGIKENWEVTLLVLLSVFLICMFYNINKVTEK